MLKALSDQLLMDIHVRALFTHHSDLRLLFVNEPGGSSARAPRMFLGRTRAGNVWRFRADLPKELSAELNARCADEPPLGAELREPPRQLEKYIRLLDKHSPVRETWAGPAYHFPQDIMPPSRPVLDVTPDEAEMLGGGFEELVAELPVWRPFLALLEGEQAVAVCRSARITNEAHEAGVETLPDFRGKGFAQEVVAAWARRVQAGGAIPMYSTSWENSASQAVARKLGLVCYGVDFHIT
jgi:RimJ/RimL family protein N-acetyltransferase